MFTIKHPPANIQMWKTKKQTPLKSLPSGYLLHSHGIDGPNRNRWFTELQNGGSFHGKL
jgi:hypothetical protein